MHVLALAIALLPLPTARGPAEDDFAARVRPVLEQHCTSCHEAEDPAGDLDLERFRSGAEALAEAGVWRRVAAQLEAGEMPPALVRERPSADELEAVLGWIEGRFGPAPAPPNAAVAGRTTLRRLNRLELRHALRDLFGVDARTAELLPADGVSHGFDVIGDALTLSPVALETCFELAETVAAAALPLDAPSAAGNTVRVDARDLQYGENNDYASWADAAALYSNGTVTATFDVARAGEYLVRVGAHAQQAGPDPARLALRLDREDLARFDVLAPLRSPEPHEARVHLRPGERIVGAAFLNDYYIEDAPEGVERDRNLYVSWIELVGPLDVDARTAFERRWIPEEDDWTARDVLAELAPLVWRGPVDPERLRELRTLAPKGVDERERLHAALLGLIASPRFLFRVEPEPEGGPRPLAAEELATRLAAFLWSSVPDELGLERAARGGLDDAPGRASEVERLLDDPRSSRLSRGFARSWLQLGRLEASQPDPRRYPGFDEALRDAMLAECELFFEAVLREGRPVSTLIDADFTFANARLAEHYGLVGVEGDALRRVPVPAHLSDRRGGLLGQAGVLTATSFPTRSSPVLRGKWVLEALLATPPPPPPPGVGALAEAGEAVTAATVRERLERHRRDPACAACHAPMDGLGFALENFDATGAWRDRDGDAPVDAGATLPGRAPFEGVAGLREVLLSGTEFRDGLARHLLVYALGRGLAPADEQDLRALLATLPRDPTLRALIHGVAELPSFRTRFPEPAAGPAARDEARGLERERAYERADPIEPEPAPKGAAERGAADPPTAEDAHR